MENHSMPNGIISPSQKPADEPYVPASPNQSQPDEVISNEEILVSDEMAAEFAEEAMSTEADDMHTMPQPVAPIYTQEVTNIEMPVNVTPHDLPTMQPTEPLNTIPTQPVPAFMRPAASDPNTVQKKIGKIKAKKLAPLVLVLLAVVFLGGSTAAAFFGVVVPNKPENKLLSALTDFASQKSITTEGIVDYTPTKEGIGVSFTYKAATDLEKNQLSVAGTIGIKGTQFPYEMRYVDKNIYAKVGGLSNLSKVLPATSGAEYGQYISAVNKISDKWYVLDRSYLESLGKETSCLTDINFALTNKDKDMLKNAYEKHPLFKIKSNTYEKINGVDTTKYVVDPASDADANSFANDLKDLSVIKKLRDCSGKKVDDKSITNAITSTKNDATGTIALNVTNDKKLKKIEVLSTEKDVTVKFNAVFTYGKVTIVKPESALPLQDLFLSMFSGFSGAESTGAFTNSQTKAIDTERQTDIKAMHGQIEAYYAQKGYYPTLTSLNSEAFRNSDLKGLNKEAYKDPASASYILAATPAKGSYAYTIKPATCNNATKVTCTSYVLTATLSDGTTYVKNSLND